jgi:hypothetical protein
MTLTPERDVTLSPLLMPEVTISLAEVWPAATNG